MSVVKLMARLNLGKTRSESSIKEYLGKAIFFCEGKTEYNYFNYFAQILNEKGSKFTEVHIELIETEGNAQTVLNCANDFYKDEKNRKDFSLYKPYLVFDCDDPKDIQRVIGDMMSSSNDYDLVLSNLLFELWLLMHFEEVTVRLKKIQIYNKLKDQLRFERYDSKEKAAEGTIRAIIGDGKPIIRAIENAKKLSSNYNDMSIGKNIKDMNPFTTVHQIMELIINETNLISK